MISDTYSYEQNEYFFEFNLYNMLLTHSSDEISEYMILLGRSYNFSLALRLALLLTFCRIVIVHQRPRGCV